MSQRSRSEDAKGASLCWLSPNLGSDSDNLCIVAHRDRFSPFGCWVAVTRSDRVLESGLKLICKQPQLNAISLALVAQSVLLCSESTRQPLNHSKPLASGSLPKYELRPGRMLQRLGQLKIVLSVLECNQKASQKISQGSACKPLSHQADVLAEPSDLGSL